MTQWNLAIASYKRKVTNGFVILKSLKQDMVSWSSKHLKLKKGHNAVCISTNKCDRKSTHCVSHTLDGGKSIASTSWKQLEQFKCVPYQRKVFE